MNFNNKKSMEKMFNCTDCQLDIGYIFDFARYCKNIHFEVIFDDTFHVMNSMGVIIKDSDKYHNGFYKNFGHSFIDVFKIKNVNNSHVKGYRLLFDSFPVFYTERKDEMEFISKGLGL